ncbi:hypothetical protein C1646_731742, partial [Rhizophagus diaphanus]
FYYILLIQSILLTNCDSSSISYVSIILFSNLDSFFYDIFWTCIIYIILII